MPIPPFDPETGCLPCEPPLHDATLAECEQAFVLNIPQSRRRPVLFGAYRAHRETWCSVAWQSPVEEWLDGSFVTSKLEPQDLDVVVWLPVAELEALPEHEQARLLASANTPRGAEVHAFFGPTFPPGHPHAGVGEALRRYWLNALSLGDGGRKGVVRIWTHRSSS